MVSAYKSKETNLHKSSTDKSTYSYPGSTGKSSSSFSKSLPPTKKVFASRKVNLKVLKKLILLNNHYVQYHVIPYDETIMVANGESIIYFQPDTDMVENPDKILELNRFILICCNQHSISKDNMEAANKMWQELESSKKTLSTLRAKAKEERQEANKLYGKTRIS